MIEEAGRAETDALTDVLCDAFHDYPVMRFIVGERDSDDTYDDRLRRLVRFFVSARTLRGDPALLVRRDGAGRALPNDRVADA